MPTESPCSAAAELPSSSSIVRDREGRRLRIATFGAGPQAEERSELEVMYETYDSTDRAQGLPPVNPDALDQWLEHVLSGLNVLVWDDDRVVGHAALHPDTERADESAEPTHELVIFVDAEYHGAAVGSMLLSELLALHERRDGGTVRLSVEPTNKAAIGLYRKFGFEVSERTAMELEMRREI